MTKIFLCWGLLIPLLVYWIIPGILALVLGFGVFRKANQHGEVAFTFDDGPDPNYTPQLLDILNKYKVKASFFVLGSKAEKFPELILRIHQEGHLIGLHNYVHRANWLMTPWTVRRHLKRSADIIEQITGVRPIHYRPPWGVLNLFDFLLKKQFRIVLWSLMVGDWWSSGGSIKVKKRLLKKMKSGAVILLHDSGETWGANRDAPIHTIEALEDVFKDLRLQGYRFVRVDEMIRLDEQRSDTQVSWKKQWLITFWMKWEMLFHTFFHNKPIDENNVFLKLRVCTYRGKTIQLDDGEQIRKGDRIAELHLDNELLFKMGISTRSCLQLAIQMIRSTEQLLPKVSQLIISHPDYQNVKGLYGISIIHRGTKQFGFTVIDLPNGLFSHLTKVYLRILLFVVHPQGIQRVKTKTDLLIPKIIAMSTKELIRRY
jgi:peptidoglycan/xylan/chitin deacetylase (PgdA/CDA1 family)